MGCHTWCYKKVERSIEEARRIYLAEAQKFVSGWTSDYENGNFFNQTEEEFKKTIAIAERQIRMVEKGLCNVAVMNKQPEMSEFIIGKGFYIECGYHDIFRIGGYPDVYLFSYDECLAFISNYEIEHNCKVDVQKYLKEFWIDNNDGLISFG